MTPKSIAVGAIRINGQLYTKAEIEAMRDETKPAKKTKRRRAA